MTPFETPRYCNYGFRARHFVAPRNDGQRLNRQSHAACRHGNNPSRYRESGSRRSTTGRARSRGDRKDLSPASPAMQESDRDQLQVVFHLASWVTGTLTRNSARYSRRPETRISRHRMTIAANSDQPRWFRRRRASAGRTRPAACRRSDRACGRARLLAPATGQIAVEKVGDGGRDEDRPARPSAATARPRESPANTCSRPPPARRRCGRRSAGSAARPR